MNGILMFVIEFKYELLLLFIAWNIFGFFIAMVDGIGPEVGCSSYRPCYIMAAICGPLSLLEAIYSTKAKTKK